MDHEPTREPTASPGDRDRQQIWKPLLFVAVLIAATAAAWHFRGHLTIEAVAREQQTLRHWQAEHPLLLVVLIVLAYVANGASSFPPSMALALLCGWLFGLWGGLALASFAAVLGATLTMLFSRYLLRDAMSGRYAQRLQQVDRAVDCDGAFYLLSLRLVHVIPFWFINLLLGWTTIRVATFWWATQLGMLPTTILYVYTGTQFPDLDKLAGSHWTDILTWPRLAALLLLAAVSLAMIPLAHWWRRRQTPVSRDQEQSK